MPDRIQDQEQRRQALDHSQSFIVQAPAGSGKTELLIQRFLTLLGLADQPESIVAITFTRKAAAQVRHRVIGALQNASKPAPETAHENFTWKLAQAALARNDTFNWRLIEYPGRLRIQTIDSLCATFVRQMPWVSRMGAPPQPEDNVAHLYRQAATETLQMLDSPQTQDVVAAALSKLLSHLDNNFGTVEKLLATMLASRDQWLRHVVGNPEVERLRNDLEDSLREILEAALGELAAIFPERFKTETVELAQFAAGNLSRNGKSGDVLACDGLQGFPATSVDALEQWRGLAGLFLTELGTRRQRLTKNEGFPATDRGRTAKERLNAIELDDTVVERLHAVRSLPPPRFEAAQWDMLGALLVLLPIAVGQLRLVFQHEGRVDFTEIAISARISLGTDAEPTDLAFAIDCQIQHLLVDEFQDTSQSQYELLTQLVGEWQPGDGRTLFLVGDPMQSIYGFREADVGLFLRARTEGVGPVVLTPLTLSVNFRSTAGVVDWVNRALGTAFPSVENRFTGAVTYEPSVPFRTESDEDAVCVHAFLASDLDLEAERVLEIIGETRTQHPDGTIAVLVRSRSHLFGIVSALRRAGERFSAVEIDALGERPVVGDLVALTRALLHPADRIAWLSLLRAPWCGLTLADLHALVDGDFNRPIWDILKTGEWQTRLSPDGIGRLERLIPVLSDAIDRRGTLAVPRWVEGVWIAIAGPACLETRTDLEAAAAYLDLLEQSMVGLDIRDERKFADDIAHLFAPSDVEAGAGLQLLTVHKAKGLEFDTVILPGLGRRTRTDDQRLLMWLEYMSGVEPRLLLAPIHKVGVNKDPIYDYLRKVHATKSDQESTRLLYVAATRARRRLHLLGHTRLNQDGKAFKAPDPRAVLSKIWGAVEADFVEAFRGVDGEDTRFPKDAELAGIPLRRLSLDWTAPAPPEDIAWNAATPADLEEVGVHRPVFEWARELQRRVGIVVHRMLQEVQAREELAMREDTLRVALRSEGLDDEKLDEALTRATVALENAVADERGRWILSGHEDDQREYTLSTVVERKVRHFVLDRTFVDDGVRWIIDYKTSTHEGSGRDAFLDNEQTRYREQMESYARAMRALDPRPIRLGLYFPLVQGWREWAFEEAAASSI